MEKQIENICIGHFLKGSWLSRCKMCKVNEDNLLCPYYNPTRAEVIGTLSGNKDVKIYRRFEK